MREALYQAIDIDAIHKNTMRGLSKPSGAHACPRRCTYDARDREAAALRPGRARRSCWPTPATRTASRSRSTARTTATSTTRRSARRWPRCGRRSASRRRSTRCRARSTSRSSRRPTRACTCWAGAARRPTPIFTLQPVLSTYNGKGDGDYNYGRYTQHEARRADAQRGQGRHERRASASADPRRAARAQCGADHHLPLHRQVIPWAARSNVDRAAPRRQPGVADLGEDEVAGARRCSGGCSSGSCSR